MYANYDQGFANGLTVRGIPVVQAHPGMVFWVGNSTASTASLRGEKGASDGNKGTFLEPFSTIAYALTQCVADRGDIIFVRPGHTLTVAATDLTIDVAGVAIIGLGTGTKRPTFNHTATGSTVAITAANVTLHNFLMTGGVDAVVAMITVSAADVTLSKIELRDVTGEMVVGVLTTAAADRLLIDGFKYYGATGDGLTAAIALVGGDRIEIKDFILDGDASVALIDVRTTPTTKLWVHDGQFWSREAADDTVLQDTVTASTGMIGPNLSIYLEEHAANVTEALTGATFIYNGAGETAGLNGGTILVSNLVGEAMMVSNIVQSTDA